MLFAPLINKRNEKANIYIITIDFLFTKVLYSQKTIDKAALDTLLKVAKETRSDAVVIYKDGKLYGEYYFGGQPTKGQELEVIGGAGI